MREARGLTSSTYTTPFWMANCTFMRPMTLSACAMRFVCSRSSPCSFIESAYGGSEHDESPECTPACSMCSMMPPISTSVPSQIASTSTSVARSRKRSSSTGLSLETLTASVM